MQYLGLLIKCQAIQKDISQDTLTSVSVDNNDLVRILFFLDVDSERANN